MKYILCLVFVVLSFSNNAQTIFIGDQSRGFKQTLLQSTQSTFSDTSQPELGCAAWTCNSLGFPTCNTRSLFRFPLNTIPTNATITSANLYLSAKPTNLNGQTGNPMFGTANASHLQRVVSQWTFLGMGWLTQPTTTTTSQKTLAQSSSTVQNYVVDVRDFVQFWVNKPDSNFGVILRLQNESFYNSMIFYSGTAPTDALKPRLEVTYAVSLPIEIKSFTAKNNGQSNLLEWSLFGKEELLNVEIERSLNAKDFNKIGIVSASMLGMNNSYQFIDANVKEGEKLFYRLKLVKKDGGKFYSSIIVVLINRGISFQLFPNPAKRDFQVSVKSSIDEETTILIHNAIGKTVHTQSTSLKKGYNSILVASQFPLQPGLYIVSMKVGNELLQQKLIVE